MPELLSGIHIADLSQFRGFLLLDLKCVDVNMVISMGYATVYHTEISELEVSRKPPWYGAYEWTLDKLCM